MPAPNESDKTFDRAILLFILGVFLFTTPILLVWTTSPRLWYLPYVLWLLVIGLGFILQRRQTDQ